MITKGNLKDRNRGIFSYAGKKHEIVIVGYGKKDAFYLTTLLVSAVLLLFLCTRNSPAFIYQDWVDPNIYMDVTRAIRKGAVLYRDIFDHKGPLLYLTLLVFSSFPTFFFSMTGMFLLQCVTLSLTLYFLYRTSRLFLNPYPSLYIGLGFLFILLNQSTYRNGGGSVEELMLPVFSGALYELIRFYIVPQSSDALKSKPGYFRLGLMVGIAALVKINLMLLPAAITFFLLVSFIPSRDYKGLGKAIVRVLGGFFLAAAPCIIYLGVTKSFSSFWQVYIEFNLLYAGRSGNIHQTFSFISAAGMVLSMNLVSVLCFCAGAICFIKGRNYFRITGQVALFFGFLVLFVTAFATSRPYPYLFIPLLSFVGLSEIAIVACMQSVFVQKNPDPGHRFSIRKWFIVIICVLLILISNGSWSETRWLRAGKTGAEFISGEILSSWEVTHEDSEPAILLFNCGDYGFYQLTETIPSLRFFYAPPINQSTYPSLIQTQLGYIRDGLPDYIIISWTDETFNYDFSKINPAYKIIDKKEHIIKNVTLYFTLYQKKADL